MLNDKIILYKPAPIYRMRSISADETYTPLVDWFVCTVFESERTVHAERYRLDTFYRYDGVPAYEFVSDTTYKKLPKDYDSTNPAHNEALLNARRTFDEQAYQEWRAFAAHARVDNPADLLFAVEKGWMIPETLALASVGIKLAKKTYCLYREYPRWKGGSGFIFPLSQMYERYEDALAKAKMMIAEAEATAEENFRADVAQDILWAVEKVPKENKQEVKFLLETFPFHRGYILRWYQNELLCQDALLNDGKTTVIWRKEEKAHE